MYVLLFRPMTEQKKKRGQPPKDIKADERINLRLLSDQKKAWEAAAKAKGVKLSVWLKELADKAAKFSK